MSSKRVPRTVRAWLLIKKVAGHLKVKIYKCDQFYVYFSLKEDLKGNKSMKYSKHFLNVIYKLEECAFFENHYIWYIMSFSFTFIED